MNDVKSDLKSGIWEEVKRVRPLQKYVALMEEVLFTATEEELHGEVSPEKKYKHWIEEREGIILDCFRDEKGWETYVVLDIGKHEIIRCGKAIRGGSEMPVIRAEGGYMHNPEDYVKYGNRILEVLNKDRVMKNFYLTVNLRQVGGSEHHPWEMGSNFSLEAASLEEAVKKAYEQSSGKPISEFTPFIDTIEGLYSLQNMEITEDLRSNQPKYWIAEISEGGKITIQEKKSTS